MTIVDWNTWFIIAGLIIISSTASYYYLEFPINIIVAFSFGVIIYFTAVKLEKNLNKGSRIE